MIEVSYTSDQMQRRAVDAILEFMRCDPEALFLALLKRGFTPHLAAQVWVEAERIHEWDREGAEQNGG